MCGRYEFNDERDIEEVKNILRDINNKYHGGVKTGEIFPTNTVPVLKQEQHKPVLAVMRWGFPRWDSKGVIINAKSETVYEKRMFQKPITQWRCVVPATGFYEWQESAGKKEKYLFTGESPMIYMAGIYNVFQKEGETGENFVILTQNANEFIAPIHHRMPVILRREELKEWLNNDDFAAHVMNAECWSDKLKMTAGKAVT